MSRPDHIQVLIAHYLATSYPSALPSFLDATGLTSPDPARPPNPDLRTLAQDYLSSQLARECQAIQLEDKATDGSWKHWKGQDVAAIPLGQEVQLTKVVRSIDGVSAANLLTCCIARVPRRTFDTATASYTCVYPLSVITTSVDKRITIVDFDSGDISAILEPHRAAVLCVAVHPLRSRYLLTGSMDGTTMLVDVITQSTLQTFRSTKFVVRVAFSSDGRWLATASYDKHVVVYEQIADDEPEEVLDDTDSPYLACEPRIRYKEHRRVKVEHNPEAILFHPGSQWLMYTTRSSYQMHYVPLGRPDEAIRTKSFNPHPMDTHVSFSVLNMALHPSGLVVACQTGDNAGHAGERILLYGVDPDDTERLGCIWTGCDSDDYVMPRMAWLPDGTALVTTSPNGLIHLISIAGEVRSSLRAHGLEEGTIGAATSAIVRDCAIVDLQSQWEVIYALALEMTRRRVVIVGIGGASCSGKTLLAKHVKRVLPGDPIILHQDDFAPPADRIPYHATYGVQDWDDPPTAIEWDQFRSVVKHIRRNGTLPSGLASHDHLNKQVEVGIDSSAEDEWRDKFRRLHASWAEKDEEIVWFIVDGFILYWEQEVVDQLDVQLFLRVPSEILKRRREDRQIYVLESGEVWTDPPSYFEQIVYPAYLKAHAHLFQGGDVECGQLIKERVVLISPGEGLEEMTAAFKATCAAMVKALHAEEDGAL